MTPESLPSPAFVSLEDRAILLRRAALQTRFRLAEQRAALEKIAASLARAKDGVAAPPLPAIRPAPATIGSLNGDGNNGNKGTIPFVATVPMAASATKRPVPDAARREAATVSAPVAASLRTETARHVPAFLHALLPFLAIGAAAMVAHAKIAPRLAVVTPPPAAAAAFPAGRDALMRLEPPVPAEDDGGAEALLLVHEWVPEGGDRTLLSMLGGEVDRPGLPPSWTVERTGPRSFLVRFRDGAVDHAFEADLEARSVRPAGESAGLFAGR